MAVFGGQVEFGEDVADVLGDRSLADPQDAGDRRVGRAFGHPGEDLVFAGRQPVEGVGGALPVQQVAHHVGVDDGLAGRDPPDRVGEVGDRADAVLSR